MNTSSLGRILGDYSAMLDVRWQNAPDSDSLETLASLYETGRDGFPIRGGAQAHAKGALAGELVVRLSRSNGRGALVDVLVKETRDVAVQVFTNYHRRLDFALFALDHDGGHGIDVVNGVTELWAASGADTWAAYAEKGRQFSAWMNVMARGTR